jgi:uncharacterized coiled-coil protein SlyX
MSDPEQLHSVESRLEKIESVLAHLQHDIDSLNASLMNHFRRLHDYESRFGRIESELQSLNDPSERPDANSERPPHY